MSGFTTGGRYGNRQVFELTSTKGAYWHRFCARDGCLGSAPSAIGEAHLDLPASPSCRTAAAT